MMAPSHRTFPFFKRLFGKRKHPTTFNFECISVFDKLEYKGDDSLDCVYKLSCGAPSDGSKASDVFV